jgi:hypothetical protein
MSQVDYSGSEEIELIFFRFSVIAMSNRPRSSLLLEFFGNICGERKKVNCWVELGDGHKYARGKKAGERFPDGQFRVAKRLELRLWMEENGLAPINWAQAHAGFERKCKTRRWKGKVKAVKRENGDIEFKTHIRVLRAVDRLAGEPPQSGNEIPF